MRSWSERLNSLWILARRWATLLVLVLWLSLVAVVVRANVTLVYFIGTPGDELIELEWETATEFNTAGFFVQRREPPSDEYEHVSDFIFAQGDSSTGAIYYYLDTTVVNGVTYNYRLEEVTTNQSTLTYDVITVTAGLPTPTPTLTPLPQVLPPRRTPRPTDTPTPTDTAAPDRTPTPTDSAAPGSTPTPTATRTPVRTSTLTPTAASNSTAMPPADQAVHTPTPILPATAPIATATATAISTSQATATVIRLGALMPPPATVSPMATTRADPVSGRVDPTSSAARTFPLPPSASTTVARLDPTFTPVSVAVSGPPGNVIDGTITGTNWFIVGVAVGLFAVAVLLMLGASLLVHLLLSR